MSANEWVKLISKHSKRAIETPSKEYKTAKQLMGEWNLQIAQTNRIIAELIEQNKIEKKKFRIRTANKTYPVTHYKIIKK